MVETTRYPILSPCNMKSSLPRWLQTTEKMKGVKVPSVTPAWSSILPCTPASTINLSDLNSVSISTTSPERRTSWHELGRKRNKRQFASHGCTTCLGAQGWNWTQVGTSRVSVKLADCPPIPEKEKNDAQRGCCMPQSNRWPSSFSAESHAQNSDKCRVHWLPVSWGSTDLRPWPAPQGRKPDLA